MNQDTSTPEKQSAEQTVNQYSIELILSAITCLKSAQLCQMMTCIENEKFTLWTDDAIDSLEILLDSL